MTKKGLESPFLTLHYSVNCKTRINEYVGKALRQRRSTRFREQQIQQRQNREQRFRRCYQRSLHVKYP